jgi:hypothetical protein
MSRQAHRAVGKPHNHTEIDADIVDSLTPHARLASAKSRLRFPLSWPNVFERFSCRLVCSLRRFPAV